MNPEIIKIITLPFPHLLEWLMVFDKRNPLNFTAWEFWLFFFAVMVGFSLLQKRITARNVFLFAISLFFYFKSSGAFFLLLLLSTLANFWCGKKIDGLKSPTSRKIWLGISVFINLLPLFYFKYTYFVADVYAQISGHRFAVRNWLGDFANSLLEQVAPLFHWNDQFLSKISFEADDIALPVGVSFFTFQTISYVVDIYREKIKPVNRLTDFGFYVSFFPGLVAGPIVRASEFVSQLYRPFHLSRHLFGLGMFMILGGMAKKTVLADFLAYGMVDRTFSLPEMVKGFEVFASLLVYSLQVYADFSGYTDMAIGVALLMGFRLPLNFNSPYKALNVADFWRRWHISLSTWLKDYLYIPLGGNRKASWGTFIWTFIITAVLAGISSFWWLIPIVGAVFLIWFLIGLKFPGIWRHFVTNINLMLTMLIGGLWHGASWNFMIWGGLNGLGLVVYKYWKKISPYEKSGHVLVSIWKVGFTFVFISLTRLFFRAGDVKNENDAFETASTLFGQMMLPDGWSPEYVWAVISGFKWVMLVFVLGMILHWFPSNWKRRFKIWFIRMPFLLQILFCVISFLIIYQFAIAEAQTFIYFQF